MPNFKFKSLEIEGYGSYKTKQIFNLDLAPGLYFIAGKNEVKPRLGSNGCGKTTAFSALVYCLYGKDIRGVDGNVLKNWNDTKVCKIILNFDKDNDSYKLVRTQGPNSLILYKNNSEEGETKTQKELDRFFGLTHEQFLYTVVRGQFNSTFLELKPTPKLDLFSSIMELDFWERCSKLASELNSKLETEAKILETKQAGLAAKIESSKNRLSSIESQLANFEESKSKELEALHLKADALLKQIEELGLASQEINISFENKLTEFKPLISTRDIVESNIAKLNNDIKTENDALIALNTNKSNLNKQLSKWKSLVGICPTCKQPIASNLISLEKSKIIKEIITINKDIEDHNSRIAKFNEFIKVNAERKTEVESNIKIKEQAAKQLENEYKNKERVRDSKQSELRNLREQIDKKSVEQNPYKSILESLNKEIETDEANIFSLSNLLAQNVKDSIGNQYWSKGFKDLRLWLISDALMALEIEANNALSDLGLDFLLKFNIERETSKKTLSRGLHVLVNSPDLKKDSFVPFEVWCGGETQRLKLAATIGLSSLIKLYKGINFNISVWDEPSSFLSNEGIYDLINFLSDYAKQNNQVIFWIDQRYLQNQLFNSVITIRNTKNGSIIEQG